MEKVKQTGKYNITAYVRVSISYGESKTNDIGSITPVAVAYQSPMEKVKPVYLTGSV